MENLLNSTRELLENREDVTLIEIAEGAGVGYEWLQKFNQGAIEDPGV